MILDGKKASEIWQAELKTKVAQLARVPKLAIVQVGHTGSTDAFVRRKKLFADSIGVRVEHFLFDEQVEQKELLAQISKLNTDRDVNGIIIQLPLPLHLDKGELVSAVSREKDVDGLNKSKFTPATARGILYLLDHYQILITGQRVVVVGRSNLVGKPTALALLERGATVTIAHRGTRDLPAITREADILVVAAGSPHLIGREHVRAGQVIIDVGITLVDGKLVGDVDRDAVESIVKAISPVPGGVGPMTVAALFANLLDTHLSDRY